MKVFVNGLFTEVGIHAGSLWERRISLPKPYAERVAAIIYAYARPIGDHSNAGVTGGIYEVDDPKVSEELMSIIVEAEMELPPSPHPPPRG